ncbi:ABC transporter ATP-binding protein [Micromonospora sp. NPDC050686]|uniref:ABC transporter ATP-binding protein n=1 Tax=Micromonospora sp. NPDC050686 TaxID=3154631 RepID=UPI0033D9E347
MTLGVEARNLVLRYGETTALNGLSFRLAGGKIHGLLGRNGSGKTSLLSLLAAFRQPAAGQVLVDGEAPFENQDVVRHICLIREGGDLCASERVSQVLDFAARMRPDWDAELAGRLVERFRLPIRTRAMSLSRGQRSALGVTLGMASRAPLTIFDEVHLGMDVPARYAFYEELLDDYSAHPRTFILSTHLIEEVSSLFEQVLIVDRGRLVIQATADELRERGAAVTGPAEVVDWFVAGRTVLGEQRLGAVKAVTIYGELDQTQREAAAAAGLELGPVALQDLFVHLTKDPEVVR